MSIAAPRVPVTWDDYEAMPPGSPHLESYSGVIVMNPTPNARHQEAVASLLELLRRACPPDLVALPAPLAWYVSQTEWYEPDVLVMRRGDVDPDGPLRTTPVLVAEVLSPSSRRFDQLAKRDAYAANGCPHYWIVDPDEPSVLLLRLEGSAYREVAAFAGDAPIDAREPFAVRFRPADLVSF